MHSNEKGKVAQDYFSLEFEFRVTQTGAYIFSMIQKKKKKFNKKQAFLESTAR